MSFPLILHNGCCIFLASPPSAKIQSAKMYPRPGHEASGCRPLGPSQSFWGLLKLSWAKNAKDPANLCPLVFPEHEVETWVCPNLVAYPLHDALQQPETALAYSYRMHVPARSHAATAIPELSASSMKLVNDKSLASIYLIKSPSRNSGPFRRFKYPQSTYLSRRNCIVKSECGCAWKM